MDRIKPWEEIKAAFQRLDHLPSEPTEIRRVCKSHVFDENQSAKWNREKAEENNAMYESEMQRLTQQRNDSRGKVIDEVCRKIQAEVGHDLSYDKAMKIWMYALDVALSFDHESGEPFSEVDIGAILELEELISLVKLLFDGNGEKAEKNAAPPPVVGSLNNPLTFEELQEMAKKQEPVWCDDGREVSAGILCWRSDWSSVPERATNIWLVDHQSHCSIYLVMEFLAHGAKFYRNNPLGDENKEDV